MNLNIDDIVVGTAMACAEGVKREITAVRDTGYSWRYPDIPDRGEWDTENSTDPFLEVGWELAK